ncbi:MAG TPA: hypothetical protein VJ827_12805 [Rubrobacter sp.]|nr:hypothetical protein [Rubrobacter sp.]
MRVPYSGIQDYDINPNNLKQHPPLDLARSGDPIWEVTAFTFGRPQAGQPQEGPGGVPVCRANDYYNQAESTA